MLGTDQMEAAGIAVVVALVVLFFAWVIPHILDLDEKDED